MGLVRLLLALAVVLGHVGAGYQLVGGRLAVQGFYLISGFLISLILSRGTYTVAAFYANRALRIYPLYFACAAVMLVLVTARGDVAAAFAALPSQTKAFIVGANLSIFGQDWALFLHPDLTFTPAFYRDDPALWRFMLLPQSWTLALELTFYAIAPFIVRRRGVLAGLVIASLAGRVIAWRAGLFHDPWTYRFFPFEIGLFAAGALAQGWLAPRITSFRPGLVTLGAVAAILVQPFVRIPEPWPSVAFLIAMAVALPGLARFQRSHELDARLGELSYPLYLVHWPAMLIVREAFRLTHLPLGVGYQLAAIAASLAAAYLADVAVVRPVERLRAKVRTGSATSTATDPVAHQAPVQ